MTEYEKYQLEWMMKNDVSLEKILNDLKNQEDERTEYAIEDYISYSAPKIWKSDFEFYNEKVLPMTLEDLADVVGMYQKDFLCWYEPLFKSEYKELTENEYPFTALEFVNGAHSKLIQDGSWKRRSKLAINVNDLSMGDTKAVLDKLKEAYKKLQSIKVPEKSEIIDKDFIVRVGEGDDLEHFRKQINSLIEWIEKYVDFDNN